MNFIRDYKYIVITVFAIIAFGVGLYLKLNIASFYQVDFQVSSDQVKDSASSFVSRVTEENLSSYKVAVHQSRDKKGLFYLERNIGQAATSTLIENGLPIYSYRARFFRFQQKEEFQVEYAPNGELTGFTHKIPEEADKSSVSKRTARQNAKSFVADKTPYEISKEWNQITSETDNSLPNRTDYTFVWEREDNTFQNGITLKDASERIKVTMHEGQVGSYSYFMHVPQSWVTKFENQQANNSTARSIAVAATVIIFVLPLLFFFGKSIKERTLRPRIALITGGIVIGVMVLQVPNNIPSLLFRAPTDIPFGGFLLRTFGVDLIFVLLLGGITMIAGMVGEVQQRSMFSNLPSLREAFSSVKTGHVRKALWVGIVLFGLDMFIVNLYYVIGETFFGFWSPANIPSGVGTSAYVPVLGALLLGIQAAFFEEYLFRMFGISYLKRYVKYTWIAIGITAIVWAFLHSSYTTDPWFLRGIELTITGAIMGWAYVRYGILSVLSWHFMFNTFLRSLNLWIVGEMWNAVAGFMFAGLPILALLLGLALSYRDTDSETPSSSEQQNTH